MLGCLAATGSLYALAAEEEKEPAAATQSAAEKSSPPAKQTPQKSRKPKTTFTPSEKVGADSTVSFPVDI